MIWLNWVITLTHQVGVRSNSHRPSQEKFVEPQCPGATAFTTIQSCLEFASLALTAPHIFSARQYFPDSTKSNLHFIVGESEVKPKFECRSH